MDTSSLIDLNSPSNKDDNPNKIVSPLIPLPSFEQSNTKYMPRLSDVDNNPFDKVLRNITNKDDPFERAFESAYVVNKPETEMATIIEEKENVSHLISPFKTPVRPKKSKKMPAAPLYINETVSGKSLFKDCDVTKTPLPKSVLDLQNQSQDFNVTDSSLQCLNESLLNKIDSDFGESFSLAINMPLPDSPEELEDKYIVDDETSTVPAVLVSNGNSYADNQSNSGISLFNNAFVDNTNTSNNRTALLSTKSSVSSKNRYSFHSDSLGNGDISNIYSSVSSTKEISSQYTLDKAFLKNSTDLSANNSDMQLLNCQRKCMSARKPTKYELSLKYLASMPDTPKRQHLNNSFAGFNYNNRANVNQKQSTGYADDSVFLEATNLAHTFSRLANGSDNNLEDENLYELSPPWLQENINFCENEEATSKEEVKISDETVTDKDSPIDEEKNEQLSASLCAEANVNDMRNAKDLLHNLTEILKCDGNVVDQRKLGENLLNSLALALNLEKPNLSVQYPVEQEQEATEVSSAEEVKHTDISPKQQCNNNTVVPKIKTQSVRVSLAPTKFEKTLKVKTEKEKVTAKGPLKAVIPVTNMAKNKRSVAPKVVQGSITPPKCLQVPSAFQVKKTSTPYELKLKAPIAQSTPDSCKPNNEADKGTPVSKRQFKYSLSPLTRPASTGDISCTEVNTNKQVSPKDTSGSVPNINKQLSPKEPCVSKLKPLSPRADSVGNVSCLNKSISSIGKPAIPTVKGFIPMSRRKSASDLKPANNLLNRSYESQKKPARPTLLKRSSSFQSKASTSATVTTPSANSKVENNNTQKKYGAPGSRLKSLSLLKK